MKMKDRFPLAYDSIKKPVAYDDHGQFITNRDGERVLDIRGWEWISKWTNAEEVQDEIGYYITALLNESE